MSCRRGIGVRFVHTEHKLPEIIINGLPHNSNPWGSILYSVQLEYRLTPIISEVYIEEYNFTATKMRVFKGSIGSILFPPTRSSEEARSGYCSAAFRVFLLF